MNTASIERLLRRDRALVVCALGVATALAWAYILWLASAMPMPAPPATALSEMPGMAIQGADIPAIVSPRLGTWRVAEFAFMFAMWGVMMVGMMLPSVTPMLLTYGGVARKARAQGKPFASIAWFAGGYLVAWVGFALLATGVQWTLELTVLLTPMTHLSVTFGGAVLIATGLYQWTPLKDTCLSTCQSPLQFIMRHGGFRRDPVGSLELGVRHGVYCVGCCWALMAILFVVGVMNVLWIAFLTVFVLAEKVVPAGRVLSRTAGSATMLVGSWMLLT